VRRDMQRQTRGLFRNTTSVVGIAPADDLRRQSRNTKLDLPLDNEPSANSGDATHAGRSERLFHGLFLLSLAGKGALGLLQLATAALLAFGLLDRLPALAQRLVRAELAEDPNDFLAAKLLELAGRAPSADAGFYTIYFAAHGALHVLVVGALLMGAAWAYPAALAVLCAFVAYQMAEWMTVGGTMLLVLSAIDLAVIALTAREWHHRQL
jgi:uncharacterized membrane protein